MAPLGDGEANGRDHLPGGVDGRLARSQEKLAQGPPLAALRVGYLRLGVQGHQRHGAVGRRQGADDVAGQGGHRLDLECAHRAGCLGQDAGVLVHQG